MPRKPGQARCLSYLCYRPAAFRERRLSALQFDRDGCAAHSPAMRLWPTATRRIQITPGKVHEPENRRCPSLREPDVMNSAKATWPPEDSLTEGTYPSVRHRLLRLGEVLYRTGMSRSGAYVYMAKGQFPRPVKLGRTSAWPEDEIEAWITARIAQRDRLMGSLPSGEIHPANPKQTIG